MLVLTRLVGESILIGPDIRVSVLHVDRGRARLGITAPRAMDIYREELLPLERDAGQDGGGEA